jgi:drug/metabolite transporter (DMT)-like permease
MTVLRLINACAKSLADYPVFQVTWARYAGHFALMLLIFVPRSGLGLLRSACLGLQLTRSALHCASAVLTFYALRFVSLPTASAISFTAPLIVTALARWCWASGCGARTGSRSSWASWAPWC